MSADPKWVILKFGGTSVASAARWQTIADQARARVAEGLRPVLVCSALAAVSDQLAALPDAALNGDHAPVLDDLRARHEALATALGMALPEEAARLLHLLGRIADGVHLVGEVGPRVRARILSAGELLSTRLGATWLASQGLRVSWQDARELLTAAPSEDLPEARQFLDATCATGPDDAVQARFAALEADVVITQGFIASHAEGGTVVLGRGGSDTSAALFASRLSALCCEIWTDVPGMFTANPRQVPSARLLTALDYAEAQEIATTGAKVLHPRCIPPVRDAGIPLHIRCTPQPDLPMTIVRADGGDRGPTVKAVSSRKGVVLVTMDTVGMWQQVGFLADAFACFKRQGLSIDLVATSETSVTVSLDPAAAPLDLAGERRLRAALEPLCHPTVLRRCAAVSLVGRRIRSMLHRLAGVFELFEEQSVHLLSQASNDLNLTVVVDEDQADRLVAQLHARLLQEIDGSPALGPSWASMTAPAADPVVAADTPWWIRRRDALLAIASGTSPAYVYDADSIDRAAHSLMALRTPSQVLFAMKANPNRDVMRRIRDAGLGFETVSIPEVARAVDILAETGSAAPVLFTPNFARRDEYAEGFALGARVTLDNLHPLAAWPEVFADQDVFVRLDPGHGHGHHAHVRTGGSRSKFGISGDQLDTLARLAAAAGCRIVGLHAHVGSGVRDAHAWTATARFLAQVAGRFPDVRVLDLGGGLGVPEKPGQPPLDLGALDRALAAVQADHPHLALWLEPGRYLVATGGVLLATVTQLKDKGPRHYVGVDTGMNSLIRPALYGAFHEIVNLSRHGTEGPWVEADVVGPICETGDVLGHGRRLRAPAEGDVLLVATAGAYGYAMASRYNLREPAVEVLLPPTA